MFADLFYQNKYSIEEIPRVKVPKILKPIYRLHFNERVNSHLILPFKEVWAQFYELYHYRFDSNEEYVVIFLLVLSVYIAFIIIPVLSNT